MTRKRGGKRPDLPSSIRMNLLTVATISNYGDTARDREKREDDHRRRPCISLSLAGLRSYANRLNRSRSNRKRARWRCSRNNRRGHKGYQCQRRKSFFHQKSNTKAENFGLTKFICPVSAAMSTTIKLFFADVSKSPAPSRQSQRAF